MLSMNGETDSRYIPTTVYRLVIANTISLGHAATYNIIFNIVVLLSTRILLLHVRNKNIEDASTNTS